MEKIYLAWILIIGYFSALIVFIIIGMALDIITASNIKRGRKNRV